MMPGRVRRDWCCKSTTSPASTPVVDNFTTNVTDPAILIPSVPGQI